MGQFAAQDEAARHGVRVTLRAPYDQHVEIERGRYGRTATATFSVTFDKFEIRTMGVRPDPSFIHVEPVRDSDTGTTKSLVDREDDALSMPQLREQFLTSLFFPGV